MSFFLSAFDFLHKGGWVAYTLAALSAVLWYALGYRYFYLQSQYLGQRPSRILAKKDIDQQDLLGDSILKLQQLLTTTISDLDLALQFEVQKISQFLSVHRQTIQSIVVVAPLLGLLGTVIGMIETFDSLQDSSLFSQSGGIAGGISQALITTQMGLVVAIPGLLIGRKLDRKEDEFNNYLQQLVGAIQLNKKGNHETQSS